MSDGYNSNSNNTSWWFLYGGWAGAAAAAAMQLSRLLLWPIVQLFFFAFFSSPKSPDSPLHSLQSTESTSFLQQNNKREAARQQKQNKSCRRTGFVWVSGMEYWSMGVWVGMGLFMAAASVKPATRWSPRWWWRRGRPTSKTMMMMTMWRWRRSNRGEIMGFAKNLILAQVFWSSGLLSLSLLLLFFIIFSVFFCFLVWARDHVDYNYIRKVAIQIRWNSILGHCISTYILCVFYFLDTLLIVR